MTKLLDQAIQKVRELPEAEQDEAAAFLLMLAAKRGRPVRLDDDTRAAVEEAEAQAQRGEFVSDEEMSAFFKRIGA
jgi:hypothetical protein